MWTEPHSETLIDACVANGLQTTPETLIDTVGVNPMTEKEAIELIRRTRCPWLVVHGDGDELQPHGRAKRLAEEANASIVTFAGAGHCSGNRDPVRFNLLLREFMREILPWRPSARTWTRARNRPRRVLMVTGDGGRDAVARDLLIVEALRARRPGLPVEWLAASSARSLLAERGEAIHPASDALPRVAGPATDPFSAWRASDEAQFQSFMILNDLVDEEPVDLVVADGAWGINISTRTPSSSASPMPG